MREEVAPDRVAIQAIGLADESFLNMAQHGRLSVQYEIRLPAGLTVAVRTQNGSVRVQDIRGRVEAAATNGAISVEGLSGSLDATIVNGRMRVDVAEVAGDLKMSSTNGSIRVDLPADVKADLDAEWVNGGVDVDSAFGVPRPASSARQLTAQLNGGGPRISVSTVNGGVRIRARGSAETD
jgi:hypothetical protein